MNFFFFISLLIEWFLSSTILWLILSKLLNVKNDKKLGLRIYMITGIITLIYFIYGVISEKPISLLIYIIFKNIEV